MGSYPLSALPFEAGFVLLALALLKAGGILGTVRSLLKAPPFDLLAYVAATLLLASVAIHVYASGVVLPSLAQSSGPRFDELYRTGLFLKHASIACLAAAGLAGLAAGAWCYRLMSR